MGGLRVSNLFLAEIAGRYPTSSEKSTSGRALSPFLYFSPNLIGHQGGYSHRYICLKEAKDTSLIPPVSTVMCRHHHSATTITLISSRLTQKTLYTFPCVMHESCCPINVICWLFCGMGWMNGWVCLRVCFSGWGRNGFMFWGPFPNISIVTQCLNHCRAIKNGKGLHSKKEVPIHRVADISGVSFWFYLLQLIFESDS